MNKMLKPLLLAGLLLGVVQGFGRIPADRRVRLEGPWEFIRQDLGNVWEAMRPVQPEKPESVPLWHSVTVPHCFNAEDAVDPDVNYYQGAGWYRTYLDPANPYPDGRIHLEFEGAGQRCDVYVYLTCVGSHTGGYDAWSVDITDAVDDFLRNPDNCRRFGGRIPVAVRCDNSRDTETIPSDMSDFNLYGGLYRYVNLVYTPSLHFEQIEVDAHVDEGGTRGTVAVRGLFNRGPESTDATLSLTVLAPDGKTVRRIDRRPLDRFRSGSRPEELLLDDFSLKRPDRWSPDDPQLYTCSLELICGSDTLRTSERFGFRHFRFEEHGPFYLNGERLLLRGTHRHEDHAGAGAAMTEEMICREMRQIKEMGANFIRLGHYQQSDIVLRMCDELGILVWEEIPWCRGGLGGDTYREQARRMLTHMIGQHRNHPSVILWGLGNENDWPGDFPDFDKGEIRAFMSELNELAHRLDASRSTCIRRCDFCKDVVDVYSPSIWAGWYSRRFTDYKEMESAGMRSTPRFIHAEWGGDSHAGRHSEGPFDAIEAADRNGDWSESYIVRLFDWHLKEQETMPELTGTLFWTFKDFSTPLRPRNPIPYVNQKGVVQRDGTPKESYYVFQSYWSSKPMLHIYGHTWPVRWGTADEPKEILVYSNCSEVELFVNGVSYGRKSRDPQDFPAAGFHWSVPLQEGENRIEAVATCGDGLLRDGIVQEYRTAQWGAPAQIRLTRKEEDATTVSIEAELLDEQGLRCLDASDFLRCTATDPAALCRNLGTVGGSSLVQAANGRAVFTIRKGSGPVTVCVRCEQGAVSPAFLHLSDL